MANNNELDELVELENENEFNNYDDDEDIIEYYMTDDNISTTKRRSARYSIRTPITKTASTSTTSAKRIIDTVKNKFELTTPADNDDQKKRLSNKLDRFCEFTLVMMHCILYKINYYNKKTHFDKYLKYNIVVYVRFKS
jgi:hypothetical protein